MDFITVKECIKTSQELAVCLGSTIADSLPESSYNSSETTNLHILLADVSSLHDALSQIHFLFSLIPGPGKLPNHKICLNYGIIALSHTLETLGELKVLIYRPELRCGDFPLALINEKWKCYEHDFGILIKRLQTDKLMLTCLRTLLSTPHPEAQDADQTLSSLVALLCNPNQDIGKNIQVIESAYNAQLQSLHQRISIDEQFPEQSREKITNTIFYLRHKLQTEMLSRERPPKLAQMAGLHKLLAALEQYPDLDSDIIRRTKIHKVLRCIVKLDHIPRDGELEFKERCNNLLYLWKQTPDIVNKQNNEPACYDASINEVEDATKGCVSLKLAEPPASRSLDGTEANPITRLLQMLSIADKSVQGLDHSIPGASTERNQNRFDVHSKGQNSAQPHSPVDSTTPSILSRLSITDIADLGSLPIPISLGLKQKVRLPSSQLLEPSNVSQASNQHSSDFDSSLLTLVKWMLPNATQATAEDVTRLFASNYAAATSFNAGKMLHPRFNNRPCQAVRRIVAEWKNFTQAPLTNICIAAPKGDDLTEWEAFMFGPSQSLYAGGVFALSINFPLSYPVEPLKLRFATPLWHPNVTENGEVALNILRHDWCPVLSIDKVLLCVHAMLSDPIGPYDAGVCPDLDMDGRVRMFLEDKTGFEKEAREWTRVYAR